MGTHLLAGVVMCSEDYTQMNLEMFCIHGSTKSEIEVCLGRPSLGVGGGGRGIGDYRD